MSAVMQQPREARLEPITIDRVPAVCAIERSAFTHPWTPANFRFAHLLLESSYLPQVLHSQAIPALVTKNRCVPMLLQELQHAPPIFG